MAAKPAAAPAPAPAAAPAAGAPPPATANAPAAGGAPARNPLGQNRPDEPAFQMKIEPDLKIVFKSDKLLAEPTTVDLKLENTTKARQTFKVKCTSNDIFRVKPPMGFIAPGEIISLSIVLTTKDPPQLNKHFFAFYHATCKEDDKNSRALWTPTTKPDGVKRIPCDFLKGDGTPIGGAPASAPAAAPAVAPVK